MLIFNSFRLIYFDYGLAIHFFARKKEEKKRNIFKRAETVNSEEYIALVK